MPHTSLLDDLHWRYATKRFDSAKIIPDNTWKILEESLVLTPSSYGLQPWKFLVVTDKETKQKLLPHAWKQTQVTDCSHFIIFASKTTIDYRVHRWLPQAHGRDARHDGRIHQGLSQHDGGGLGARRA